MMHTILLIVIFAIVCIVLFTVGVIAPRRSRRMQQKVDELSLKAEQKGDDNAGRVGDAATRSLEKMRGAADASAEKGREIHDRVIDPED